MSDKHHEEAHTGPIKNPKQLLITVLLAFILPVILIIGLVTFVGSAPKTGAGVGMQELAQAQRLQKVGSVEIRDANRPLRGGDRRPGLDPSPVEPTVGRLLCDGATRSRNQTRARFAR